ncbi:sigma-70 family RNA polymerase sigma factor [Flavobacterium sp. CFS9]|uniref:Sigma-70 family RNA polymerase sigma factor n=1 Tax=Flavobacterium sp. CFS9 TaxID=3143118 RepID=A0AAT9H685_9FLAO
MNKEQFIEVIREHKNIIYKICHTYCSNKENHKDLEQDIILQLWKSMDRYNGSVKMSTWLYRIALNTAISFYRKEGKRKHISDQSILLISDDSYDTRLEEQTALLHEFIAKLNSLDKALMVLYLDDTRYRDIAVILGISESNIATKINRIKSKLKDFFNQQNL